MFDTDEARKRIEVEKPLFDYARMYLTIIALVGVCGVGWRLRPLADPFTAVLFYPSLAALVVFTCYLAYRFHELNEDLAATAQIRASLGGKIAPKLFAWLVGLFGVMFAFSVFITVGALLEGIK